MKPDIHTCQIKVAAAETGVSQRQSGPRVMLKLRRLGQIARDVLRGYLMGQPPDESRPRKGCC